VHPEVLVPAAAAAATPALNENQPLVIGIVTGPQVAARGRGTAAIGIQDTKSQNILGRLCASPVPVILQGIGRAWPDLTLAAPPDRLRWWRPRNRFKKAHAIRLTLFPATRDSAQTAHSRRRSNPEWMLPH